MGFCEYPGGCFVPELEEKIDRYKEALAAIDCIAVAKLPPEHENIRIKAIQRIAQEAIKHD